MKASLKNIYATPEGVKYMEDDLTRATGDEPVAEKNLSYYDVLCTD